jgi:hypothetical protein
MLLAHGIQTWDAFEMTRHFNAYRNHPPLAEAELERICKRIAQIDAERMRRYHERE